jgi:methylmalonyl-CoA mutase N-terminal domain/subunit
MRIITDLFAWASRELPSWNTISISGYHIREAGSTATQEVAFTIANAIAYVQTAIDAGLDVDEFGPQLSFFFNAHNSFLEEIAKFRAARRLWAHTMRERFGAKQDRSCMLRFHAQTGGSTLTAQQPENNVVRVTVQALAAVLGGAQSLHTNGRDEALSLPSEESAQIALRTQQIIAFESGISAVPDPFGGSVYIEQLTDEIEADAKAYIERIDSMGGTLAAVEKGFIQAEIQNAAYEYQKAIEEGKQVVVGVNKYETNEPNTIKPFKINANLEREQIERVRAVRASRSPGDVEAALKALESAARSSENLLPKILDACRALVTVGEISDCLRTVFGEYREAF